VFYRLSIIVPTELEIKRGVLELKYSCVKDEYLRVCDDTVVSVVSGWRRLVHEAVLVFRKVENDWQTTYLCREEGAEVGKMVWLFEVGSERNVFIRHVEIFVNSTCFKNGHVLWTLTDNRDHRAVLTPGRQQSLEEFRGSTKLRLTAELSGGDGSDRTWQHAQLFRQKLSDSAGYPLHIALYLLDQQ